MLSLAALLRHQLTPEVIEAEGIDIRAQLLSNGRAWAALTARRNRSHCSLAAFLTARLQAEGHVINRPADHIEDNGWGEYKGELKKRRELLSADARATARPITRSEADDLRRQQFRTRDDDAALGRLAAAAALALPVNAPELTTETIQWADDYASGGRRLAHLLHLDLAQADDLERRQQIASHVHGTYQPGAAWDQTAHTSAAALRKALGLLTFLRSTVLAGHSWDNEHPEVVAIAEAAQAQAPLIKRILGITTKTRKKTSPLEVVHPLLQQLGIAWKATRGKGQARRYWVPVDHLAQLQALTARLQERRKLDPPVPVDIRPTAPGGSTETHCAPADLRDTRAPIDGVDPRPPVRHPSGGRGRGDSRREHCKGSAPPRHDHRRR